MRTRIQRRGHHFLKESREMEASSLPALFNNEPWMAQAVCKSDMEGAFTPQGRAGYRDFIHDNCFVCPVIRECLAYALSFETTWTRRYGVFGGMTPEDRTALVNGSRNG